MVFKQTIDSLSKTFLIVLIASITVTSVKIQSASAQVLLPTPVFITAAEMAYDAIQQSGFVVPDSTIQATDVTPIKFSKRVVVTAYNSVPGQTDNTPCISADGSNICELKNKGEESCAAALPFGTKINIPGFGVCTVRDRLAPRFSNRIDLYFGGKEKISAAKQWGKRALLVDVLDTKKI
jgi:3D (Asp-Asp-Asp) domain-containing protein